MPDVTELIEQEHRQVEALFQSFKESGASDVLTQICDELDAHAAAEEQAFYPVVRDDVPSGKKLADEAKDEHGEARQLIGRIRRTSDPDHVVELVNELEQAVSHHVDEEEQEMLPLARQALGEDRLMAVGSAYESAKANVRARS
jgi:hemerythrin-like domain-containing protein